ncbi:hypothetical protein W97_06067 [Coniosporium apollinis CBS 100218]|uniref:Transmembrane protein n=1 Tax=Coniosporium apollinis (strain CBS 100218) TaxID=1168221 RepID=R7YZ49_CONA1|nr:uncharacterized protein W97_06067 [Coniosporium apollinis CBS 100218]EON66951.1 hypothetical protein W97_06067 [Coniosporium apollinis CBS 100218]
MAADLYGTLLWALDAPGYTAVKQNVTAASVTSSLLEHPGYLVQWSRPASDVAALEEEMQEVLGANLFKPGFNFTLTGENQLGQPVTVSATRAFDEDVGPRIWLDNEGLSVSIDPQVTVGFLTGRTVNSTLEEQGYECPKVDSGNYGLVWNCTYNNRYAISFLDSSVVGRPTVHWDDESDQQLEFTYLSPRRQDNPWQSLGKGGSTAVMKQVFTVTKGRTRHTFIQTTFKVAAVSDPGIPFSTAEIESLIRRTWSADPAEQQHPLIAKLAGSIVGAQRQNKSFMFGVNTGTNGTLVSQTLYELASPERSPGRISYSMYRMTLVHIALIRSEIDVLPEPVQPAEACNIYFFNEAHGGRLDGTNPRNCLGINTGVGSEGKGRFFGQVDASAVFLADNLGDGTSNLSDVALNQQGYEWFLSHETQIDSLLLSRGLMLGLDPSLVTLETSTMKPAISYLQVVLVLAAVLAFAVSWACLFFFGEGHYSSSLLANLLATTAANQAGDSRSPGYVHRVPEIKLKDTGVAVVMATPFGIFRHDVSGSPSPVQLYPASNDHSKHEGQYHSAHEIIPTPNPEQKAPLLWARPLDV